ncbi:hypothetical protein [Ktedonobacter racemifer]|uniref:Uncharacterized protein n=1 Tax=Ktedonobacter racemifer DSM 44963 TaxID=485913 RepID=D6TZX5_KTERA|nr:hypothetical protein [Ktedonobacter racemifer]EFH82115.1 hypothetical protein Krac_2895 [Ktedonobacter racemifer DSM 44963]
MAVTQLPSGFDILLVEADFLSGTPHTLTIGLSRRCFSSGGHKKPSLCRKPEEPTT